MTHNFTHYKGDTFSATFAVEQDGSPINLTAYTIRMHIRPSQASSTLSLDLTDNIEIYNAVGGLFRINEVIIDLPARVYYYDIEFTSGAAVSTWLAGTFTVYQDVTR